MKLNTIVGVDNDDTIGVMTARRRAPAQFPADLRQVRYFVAVAEERNYTRAAERLHVAQQSVSATIKQFEVGLGVQLLERNSRRVALTAAGEALYERATKALEALELALEAARSAGGIAPKELRVGYNSLIGRDSLIGLHKQVHGRMPLAHLSWRPRYNDELLDETLAGEFDVGLALFPDRVDGLEYGVLGALPLGMVVDNADLLAELSSPTLADFDGRTVMTIPRALGPRYYDEFARILGASGAEVKIVEAPDLLIGVPPPEVEGPVIGLGPLPVMREYALRHRERAHWRALDKDEGTVSLELVTRRGHGHQDIDQFAETCAEFGSRLAADSS